MKRILIIGCCILFPFLFLFSACSPAVSFISASTPAFPGLAWGMSKEEVFEALGVEKEDTEKLVESTPFNAYIYQINEYSLGGKTMSLLLYFPDPQWEEESGMDLGLYEIRMLCDKQTAAAILEEFEESGYSLFENVSYQEDTAYINQKWSGPNAYQASLDKGLWEEMEKALISIHGLEGQTIPLRDLDTPEKLMQYYAKDGALSSLSYYPGYYTEENGEYFTYYGFYAAALAMVERQQTP